MEMWGHAGEISFLELCPVKHSGSTTSTGRGWGFDQDVRQACGVSLYLRTSGLTIGPIGGPLATSLTWMYLSDIPGQG